MNHEVRVYEVARDASGDRPRELPSFGVTAETIDAAREVAIERLKAEGRAVRCVSFLARGGIAAIVYPLDPEPVEAAAAPVVRMPRARARRAAR